MRILKEQGNELFFVQLKEPSGARRRILETLKELLELLQRFEKFKHLRHEKIEKIQKLRMLMRQANKMFGDLKTKMPQTTLRAVTIKEAPLKHKKEQPKKKQKGKPTEVKATPKREMTDLDKLEAELSAIEGKLKSLT